jgi:hypothetical protein
MKYQFSYSTQFEALAFLPTNEKTLTVYYRKNGKIVGTQMAKDISNFKWSTDGRDIFYYNGTTIRNYNWEEEKETATTFDSKIVNVEWYFDNSHYLVQTEKELFVVDFDGANKVVMSDKPILSFYPDSKLSSFVFSQKIDSNTINKRNSSLSTNNFLKKSILCLHMNFIYILCGKDEKCYMSTVF